MRRFFEVQRQALLLILGGRIGSNLNQFVLRSRRVGILLLFWCSPDLADLLMDFDVHRYLCRDLLQLNMSSN
ncbi:unnamed protein product [Agarophyton chilense]